jgi:hypothetical protein
MLLHRLDCTTPPGRSNLLKLPKEVIKAGTSTFPVGATTTLRVGVVYKEVVIDNRRFSYAVLNDGIDHVIKDSHDAVTDAVEEAGPGL